MGIQATSRLIGLTPRRYTARTQKATGFIGQDIYMDGVPELFKNPSERTSEWIPALSGDASGPISIAGVVAASTGAAIVVAAIVVVVGF